jgi:hypothetical protein
MPARKRLSLNLTETIGDQRRPIRILDCAICLAGAVAEIVEEIFGRGAPTRTDSKPTRGYIVSTAGAVREFFKNNPTHSRQTSGIPGLVEFAVCVVR